jgi:hypothetical protein
MPHIRSLLWTLPLLGLGCMAQVDEPLDEEPLEDSSEQLASDDPSADDEDALAAEELGLSTQALIGPNDVGVIQPDGMNCGSNEHVMLQLESEKDGNWNSHSGWIGAIEQPNHWTKWHFCRVDGRNFGRVSSNNSAHNYAVLKLGTTCPAGSVEFERYFDAEDRPSGCNPWPLSCGVIPPYTEGNIAPNYYSNNNLHMKFCMFRASPTQGTFMPLALLGMPYGVFGTPELPGALASGEVHTDDEDDNNTNNLYGDWAGADFLEADRATTLHVTKVNPQFIFIPF